MVPDESLAGCVVLTISVTHSVELPSPSLSFPFMHRDHPLQYLSANSFWMFADYGGRNSFCSDFLFPSLAPPLEKKTKNLERAIIWLNLYRFLKIG